MDGPKVPTTIHGLSGLKYQLLENANTTADLLVILFTHHDLNDNNYEHWLVVRILALLIPAGDNFPEGERLCGVKQLTVFKTGKSPLN